MKRIRKSYRLTSSTVEKVKNVQFWLQRNTGEPYTETEVLESLIHTAYLDFWRDKIENSKKGG